MFSSNLISTKMNDYVKSVILNPLYTVNTTLTVTYNVFQLLKSFISYNMKNKEEDIVILPGTVEYTLAELDIINTVNSLSNLLNFIEQNVNCNAFLTGLITQIKELVQEIRRLHKLICEKINAHRSKYLSNLRKLNLDVELNHLLLKNSILLKRRGELYEILKLSTVDVAQDDKNNTTFYTSEEIKYY